MPFYEVQHACPLDKTQRDEIAKAITFIHTRKFCTPSLFVNLNFTNSSEHCTYIGGEEVGSNTSIHVFSLPHISFQLLRSSSQADLELHSAPLAV